MLGESSSEESDENKSDNDESDYESSDDINGDDVDVDLANKEKPTMITRRRKSKDDPVIISISETAKLRKRKSKISIQEPAVVAPILVGPLMKRKRDFVRLPAKRFKDGIVGSASSSPSSKIPTQVNVNGGTNTKASSSSSQDSIFGSALGSNNTRASSVNPNSLLSGSSSSSGVHAQPCSSSSSSSSSVV